MQTVSRIFNWVERTPHCVLYNLVHLVQIALRPLRYIPVHRLNISMLKKMGKWEKFRAKLSLPVRALTTSLQRHLMVRPMFFAFLQCFPVDNCRIRCSEYLCLTLLQQRQSYENPAGDASRVQIRKWDLNGTVASRRLFFPHTPCLPYR